MCVSVRAVEDIFQTWLHLSLGGSLASSLFLGHSQPRVPYKGVPYKKSVYRALPGVGKMQ